MKNFFDCKEEKITEKAFSRSLLVSIFSILLCVVSLCSVTYAWFTTSTESESNVLSSGSFDVTISVLNSNGEEIPLSESSENPGEYSCMLPAGKYTVTLKMTDESTVKGHCFVKIGSQEYNTEAILRADTKNSEGRTPTDPLTFTIDLTSATAGTELILSPRWGEVVEPTIFQGGIYPSTTSNAGEENN